MPKGQTNYHVVRRLELKKKKQKKVTRKSCKHVRVKSFLSPNKTISRYYYEEKLVEKRAINL